MDTNKLLSALAYFSIFFLGFIFPAALYFVAKDAEVRRHAKAAFLSHCLPFAAGLVSLLVFGLLVLAGDPFFVGYRILLAIGFFLLPALIWLVVAIWNVVKGIQVLTR